MDIIGYLWWLQGAYSAAFMENDSTSMENEGRSEQKLGEEIAMATTNGVYLFLRSKHRMWSHVKSQKFGERKSRLSKTIRVGNQQEPEEHT